MIAIRGDGGRFYILYCGKSWEMTSGVRKRIGAHFNFGKNWDRPSPLTLIHWIFANLMKPLTYYIALCDMDDCSNEEIRCAERDLLNRIDFLGNDQFNGGRRLEALLPILSDVEEDHGYEFEGEEFGNDDYTGFDYNIIVRDYQRSEKEEKNKRMEAWLKTEEGKACHEENMKKFADRMAALKAEKALNALPLQATAKDSSAPSLRDVYSRLAEADVLTKSLEARFGA